MLSVTCYLLLAVLLCACINYLCAGNAVMIQAQDPGTTDLTEFDFSIANALVATESTQSIYIYSGAFYTSEDFAAGKVNTVGVIYDRSEGAQGDYGTLRMELKLPPGHVYAIAAKNISYAQRLFIDGKEYKPIGTPANEAHQVIPQSRRFIEAFQPTGETTEFIFHYAAFVHADGGGLYPMRIGYVEHITRQEQLELFRSTAVAAALLMFSEMNMHEIIHLSDALLKIFDNLGREKGELDV